MKIISRTAAALGKLLGRASAPPPDDSPEVLDGWIRIYPGDELLARPENVPFVQKINANFRGTPSQAFELLDIPLHRFATLVQLLPAAEYYHHPERGGLLLHQLECMAMATAANYQIHQLVDPRLVKDNTPPEFIFFTNYCFHLRALTHDIGKLRTLFNIELLIERSNGKYIRMPYHPMDGGFASVSLAARAAREKENGARSVRYRYTFERSGGIHDHEAYWEIGIQRLLDHLPNPVPGQHVSLHLTDSESFRTHLRPKLAEIDHRSVGNYHTRTERSATPEQVLYKQFLLELACHSQLKSAELVRSVDGEQLLFLPYSVLQVFLNELPPIDPDSSIPRHPEQCLNKLKAAGYTTQAFWIPGEDPNEYNGRRGAFLNADITAAMLGAPFLRRCADNVSARLGQLIDLDALADQPSKGASTCRDAQDTGWPPPLPSAPQMAQHCADPVEAPQRPVSSTPTFVPTQSDVDIATSALVASGTIQPPPTESPQPTSVPHTSLAEAVAAHLESMTPCEFQSSPHVSLRKNSVVFSSAFMNLLLRKIGQTTRLPARHYREFAENSSAQCPDKWSFIDGELVCTPAYTERLLGKSVISPDAVPPLPPAPPFTHPTRPSPASNRSLPPASGPATNAPPSRDRNGELKSLMETVCTIYQRTGERLLETDGPLARLDFRAVDEHTGDKQRRGRVLEMLRHLGLYIEHKKGTAVLIKINHPEVQTCLADLQRKR